jgi:hypothetical protein
VYSPAVVKFALIAALDIFKGREMTDDWSELLVAEFGERVKPHLDTVQQLARAVLDGSDILGLTRQQRDEVEEIRTLIFQERIARRAV